MRPTSRPAMGDIRRTGRGRCRTRPSRCSSSNPWPHLPSRAHCYSKTSKTIRPSGSNMHSRVTTINNNLLCHHSNSSSKTSSCRHSKRPSTSKHPNTNIRLHCSNSPPGSCRTRDSCNSSSSNSIGRSNLRHRITRININLPKASLFRITGSSTSQRNMT